MGGFACRLYSPKVLFVDPDVWGKAHSQLSSSL